MTILRHLEHVKISRNNRNTAHQIWVGNLNNSSFNASNPTRFTVHGYNDGGFTSWIENTRDSVCNKIPLKSFKCWIKISHPFNRFLGRGRLQYDFGGLVGARFRPIVQRGQSKRRTHRPLHLGNVFLLELARLEVARYALYWPQSRCSRLRLQRQSVFGWVRKEVNRMQNNTWYCNQRSFLGNQIIS